MSNSPTEAGAETSGAKKHRRHRRLHGKARRAELLTQKLANSLGSPEPDAQQMQKLVGELKPVLASLRRSTLKANGPQATLVAEGIDDLAIAFEDLVKANQASDLDQAAGHLTKGTRAFERATAKAREAGDAWPL
ncbi:MAG TPA: hypothetical protein VGN84_05770 [Solirubrobacterales bacterium]|jgi:hypothetical protein|nr:hypothetical protein [Solirubrobacterales bacterium]